MEEKIQPQETNFTFKQDKTETINKEEPKIYLDVRAGVIIRNRRRALADYPKTKRAE